MNSRTYTVNTKKAISETLDNETIIINLETGCYYSMNPAGTAIWGALTNGVPITITTSAVEDFLNQLITDGLITEINTPPNPLLERGETHALDLVVTEEPKLEKYTDMQEMLLADPIHDVDTAGWPNLKKD